MGGEKQSSQGTTVVNQTTTPTPTAEETAMNKLLLERMQATQGQQIQAQQSGLGLVNQLLTGSTQLPGYFGKMAAGISPEAIGQEAVNLTRQSNPYWQSQGIYDSGVAPRETAKMIADRVLFPSEQFNIGVWQNLVNQALTGQAQVQAPIQSGISTLASNLQGLRTVTNQGTTTSSMTQRSGKSFFDTAFMGGIGQGIGSAGGKMLFGG